MSSSRGATTRNRPQKHQNRTAFKNDLHDTSKQTKLLNSMSIGGVCLRCKSILEWKIKYKKYKPLTSPRKCVSCDQKTIKSAYHVLCHNCSKEKNVCSKCCKPADIEDEHNDQNKKEEDLMILLQKLPERKRRTVLRNIKKQQNGDTKVTEETKAYIDDVVSKIDKIDLDDDDSLLSDDFDDSDDGNYNIGLVIN